MCTVVQQISRTLLFCKTETISNEKSPVPCDCLPKPVFSPSLLDNAEIESLTPEYFCTDCRLCRLKGTAENNLEAGVLEICHPGKVCFWILLILPAQSYVDEALT